jgi:hypothetical protein
MPVGRRQAALKTLKRIQERYAENAGGTASSAAPSKGGFKILSVD